MKIKYLLIAITLIAFACKNTTQETEVKTETPKEEIAKLNVQKIEFSIDGMTCTGCENTIQNTINAMEGVYTSKADHEKGIAVAEVDSTIVDLAQIEAAINNVGYKSKGHHVLSK